MHANRSTLVKLCLLTALAVPVQRAASAAVFDQLTGRTLSPTTSPTSRVEATNRLLLAQAADVPEFTLPDSLAGTETLLIDGSSSMRSMNDALTERFTARYEAATVSSEANGTDTALDRLRNDEINLAAIGRPLTEAEQAEGFVAVPIALEKIAIFVSSENPFEGDITFEQFVQIFRGEITDWADVGDGSGSGQIRLIDRPESSDTRQAFRRYPIFQAAPFETGTTAEPVETDDTEAVIAALGDTGIGYSIANQVIGNPAVKIVPMHQTLPDNPDYPFSQSRSYVYRGEPSPAVQGFLAVATSPEGEDAIAQVQETEGAAAAQLAEPAASVTSPDGQLIARTNEDNIAIIEDADGNLVAGPLTAAGGAVTALAFSPDGQTLATGTNTGKVRYWGIDGEPKGEAFQAVIGTDNAVTELNFEDNDKLFVAGSQGRQGLWGLNGLSFGETVPVTDTTGDTTGGTSTATGRLPGWLWLIPLLGVLGLAALWLLGRRRREETVAEPKRQTAPTATVTPPIGDPEGDRAITNRAHSVISTDRVVGESREGMATGAAASASIPSPLPGGELGTADAASTDTPTPEPTFESTDLESPDLEGTNLDLLTPGAFGVGAAAVGGAAIAAGISHDLGADLEAEDDDDEWDDNLDLTLDDSPDDTEAETASTEEQPPERPPVASLLDLEEANLETANLEAETDLAAGLAADLGEPEITGTAATPPPITAVPLAAAAATAATAAAATGMNDDDFWNTTPEPTEDNTRSDIPEITSAIDSIEPTRNTVIAETDTVLDIEPDENTIIGDNTVIFDGATALSEPEPEVVEPIDSADPADPSIANTLSASAALGIASGAAAVVLVASTDKDDTTEDDTAPSDSDDSEKPLSMEALASVDDGLADLPDGYGESRIVLLPRDPKWAYAYWEISNEHKEELRQQGGERLMLRLYDVTDINQNVQAAHSMQQQDCNEMARSWYIEIPVSDRDYSAELGYLTADEGWLMLARSAPVRIPPIYPSDWVKDQFVTIGWQDSLQGRSFGNLGQPATLLDDDSPATDLPPIYGDLFALTQSQNALRVAGSLFGSMQMEAPEIPGIAALSPSGAALGLDMALNMSGLNMSGLNVSGLNMSGVGLERQRNFWLVADAELIVYGATEPDATVTIGNQVIPLNPDGTFRFHMHFPDGTINYPIRAVAADGEQSRAITMNFERETPERNTNTPEEAKDEWF
ncbi:MAG: hypothetical protein HLUCCA11_07155 [Phormidesmis priestleyi Ana]|uniref:PBP domain-containing protein n=1 Tax=Phormidesmis priestleyi Ana TaxID=1666911 RepID=A0A0P8DHX6_9CYAN|nr:MAG: hypothetical protein HLUCCA11_07155 [Phormidesmis priestleyi Ana]